MLSTTPTSEELTIGPTRCPVFLCSSWKRKESVIVFREVRLVVKQPYYAVHFTHVYTTIRVFTVLKDVLPTHQLSHLVYNFECRRCASRYVGRTVQHLSTHGLNNTHHYTCTFYQRKHAKTGLGVAGYGSTHYLCCSSLLHQIQSGYLPLV